MKGAYRPSDNEDPLFLPTRPLHDLVSTLGESVPASIRPCHAIELEEGRNPSKGDGLSTDTMLHVEVGVLCMNVRVQGVIQ